MTSDPASEIPSKYDPTAVEQNVGRRWTEARAFAAAPDGRERRYVIMMPLPNVTGALHMGHALDNVMQDLLTRWHRMAGDNTLWMAGTDHAGIATQSVVEKRLLAFEGKTRNDIGREALVERIWRWKDEYQARIVRQQQAMGCSCDWDRQRFTMDAVCARAVRWTFFNMFRDGLVFQGYRLVNWDCHLQTAIADDEIVMRAVRGNFWHLRYPIADRRPDEPEFVVVATTRPETMLGDTAVACHPDPRGALAHALEAARERLARAAQRDRPALEAEVAQIETRVTTHLPRLLQLAAMARAGRTIRLPLTGRVIPLILDEWAKPELGSGCVKITPAHDPNDYAVWLRHRPRVDIVNILNPDGTLNAEAGAYKGLERFAARKRVVADLEAAQLLEAVEERELEIGHSDRSDTPVEPYLSKQWFVRMGDRPDTGIVCGRGTGREFRTPGLAQAAIDAASGTWRSPSGRRLRFHPDGERYAGTYLAWLGEKRDWCISRQLWWGHRIPIWARRFGSGEAARFLAKERLPADVVALWLVDADGNYHAADVAARLGGELDLLVCLRDEENAAERAIAARLENAGLVRDPDVLDTWFSSGLWPHSTLGWPDPATAPIEPGQSPLGAVGGAPDCLSYYYPGSCLVSGRDIITLWVARMVMMGLYNLGDLPFTDVFVHANILDGKGERMSKSKGNGIDPVDIIERYGADAMRYVLCEIQTGTQDIRLPVMAVSPFTGNLIDLAKAKRGRGNFSYLCPESGKEFDVLGTLPDVPTAKLMSERFDIGRNFCNKLWNAARFAFMNLEGTPFAPRRRADLATEDRWILSRLAAATARVEAELEAHNPSAALGAARELFWSELCDWYLELLKPRMRATEARPLAQQVLAAALDQVLRLLHPFVPFITEELWRYLGQLAPVRGIEEPFPVPPLLVGAPWPEARAGWRDGAVESELALVMNLVRAIREMRSRYNVPPAQRIDVRVRAEGERVAIIERGAAIIAEMAGASSVRIGADVTRAADAATAVVEGIDIYAAGLIDVAKERARLEKQLEGLTRQIEGAARNLANADFRARAKPEVVAREQERLARLEDERRGVDAALGALP